MAQPTHATPLSPARRAADIGRMRHQTFDILVIGGGVTGTGIALDAATRGLDVAMVEQRDFASGTSSRSSKLIHGGLRYLEQLNFSLVREALQERGLLLDRLAPHLIRPVPFLYPLQGRGWERPYVAAGVALYDMMGGARQLPRHTHFTRKGALRLAPALKPDSLVGAVQYWDAQVDDARHTMALGRTAAHYGAAVLTSARVTGLLREGERVVGAEVHDLETGEDLAVRASQVVNATGVWANEIQAMAGRGRVHVRPSKGIHLVVPRDRIHSDTGIILRTDTSVLFIIPWPSQMNPRHWLIGTTDTDWELDLAHPAASAADIDYLLAQVNRVLRTPLTPADVEGVFAGLRPLLYGESESTSTLSREHAIGQSVAGLLTIAGGKYTTYRIMAQDSVDAVARNLDKRVPDSVTDTIPVLGAEGYAAMWNQRGELAEASGLHQARIEHLLRRHGTLTTEVLDLIADDTGLAEPLPGADDYLLAEVVYAASHEGALHLDDVLTRRTRASIEAWDRGVAAAKVTAELMAPILGWDEDAIGREVEHYLKRVEAERESQVQPDDHTADAARMGAPDVRIGFRPVS